MSRGKRKLRWTPQDVNTLRAVWPGAPRAEVLAALPGRTWDAIQRKVRELGVSRRYWTGKSRDPRPPVERCRRCTIRLDSVVWAKDRLCPDCWYRSCGIVVDWQEYGSYLT